MKRGAVWIMATLTLTAAVGCRAGLEGKKILRPGSDPKSGIIYYLTQPSFTIDVKDRADNKDAEPAYDLKTASAPDSQKRFSVRLKSGTISRDVLSLKLQPNGTLTSLGATSESQIPQLVTALGSLAASALSFGTTGVGALAAVLSKPPEYQSFDAALQKALCAGDINPQEFSNMRCAARKLLGDDPKEPRPDLPCAGGDSQCSPAISIPPPTPEVLSLQTPALQGLFDVSGRLIDKIEPTLWEKLSQTVPDGRLRRLAQEVDEIHQSLQKLRALEGKLASKLDADPRHAALTPPDPSRFPPGNIHRNLMRLISTEIDNLQKAEAHGAQATTEETQAILEFKEAEAKNDVNAKQQATQKRQTAAARRQTAADDAESAATFLASLAGIADVAFPGLLDQPFNDRINDLEKKITTSFAKGSLATQKDVQQNEQALLAMYRVILKLRAIRQSLPSPPTPKQQIATALANKKRRAEQLYAKFVSDAGTRTAFETALAEYQQAIDRFLEVDDRLQDSRHLRKQQQALAMLPKPTGPTGNESKAYRDYREELDRVLDRINGRIGSAIDPKTPEKLPRGTQVTRTLDQMPACVLGHKNQLTDRDEELLRLAEMWIKYGGKESIVFRTRSSPPGTTDRLDCGADPFGASVSARHGKPPSQVSTPATMRRVASGMHVRRLTLADIEDAEFQPQGVLVQVPVPYDVIAVLVAPSGDRVLKAANLSLPADDEFLDIGFKGGLFRSQELSVALNPNGSVAEYKLDSVQKVSDTVQSVADATKGITDTLVEIQKAQPAAANPVDTENSKLRLEILNLMLKENLRAIQEGRDLPFPDLFKS